MPDQVKKRLVVEVDIKGKKDLLDARTAVDRLSDAITEYRKKTKTLHGAAKTSTENYTNKLRDQLDAVKKLMAAEQQRAKAAEDAAKKEAKQAEEKARRLAELAQRAKQRTATAELAAKRQRQDFWQAPSFSRAWRERLSPVAKLRSTLAEQRALEDEGLRLSFLGESEEERKLGADQAATAGKAADAAAKKLAVIGTFTAVLDTAKKIAGAFNSALKSATGISFSIKDMFSDVANTVSKMMSMSSGIATYNMGSSLITNAGARNTALKYGLTAGQTYAFTQTSEMLGIHSDVDLAYMNPRQREMFISLMQKQEAWYAKLESSGMLESIQELQIEFSMFKQELAVEFLDWVSKNKDTIMTVLKGMLNLLKFITNALSSVFSLFGSNSSTSYSSAAMSDTAAAGAASIANTKNVSVKMSNNVNGVFDSQKVEEFLNERLNTTFRAAAINM